MKTVQKFHYNIDKKNERSNENMLLVRVIKRDALRSEVFTVEWQ